ncbi:MAG TPA: PilZ domain-containing protein [Candidatus Omnitrophota bacterium]|nr:PilZ domain-containing protein [Candidatus Omnitrophota bacterium]HPT07650.1 PilZ domain-containing protein [Candidatus Omnitrophota bacterium]
MAQEKIEKRRFPRIGFKFPLSYKIRGSCEFDQTIANDISCGGLSFVENRFLAPETRLMFEIKILDKVLHPIGRIAWANQLPHSNRYNLGVEFLEMEMDTRDYLCDFVDMQISNKS